MYQVVTPNERMMNAYQNVIQGKPDCWDVQSEHETLADAEKAAKKIRGRVAIRLSDDISPNFMISDKYRIKPEREPELNARVSAEEKAEDDFWK